MTTNSDLFPFSMGTLILEHRLCVWILERGESRQCKGKGEERGGNGKPFALFGSFKNYVGVGKYTSLSPLFGCLNN